MSRPSPAASSAAARQAKPPASPAGLPAEPAVVLAFDFQPPPAERLPGLRLWLAEALDIQESDVRVHDAVRDASPPAREFLMIVLLLVRRMLQLGRLPVFDPPLLLALQPHPDAPGRWQARAAFQGVLGIGAPAHQLALQVATELCSWMADRPPTPEHREHVYQEIEHHATRPLQRMSAGGKSTIPVLRVAHALGIPFQHLGRGAYQLGWGSKARRMDRSASNLDSALGAKLSQDKVTTAQILRRAGLPAPVHILAANEKTALQAAREMRYPVVVKPADRDRGEGVTVDIYGEDGVRIAFREAQRLSQSRQVIVERQVAGVCHRLFIAGGSLLYAVKRLPMSVRGDGVRTVARLVADEVALQLRKPAWQRSEIRPLDDLARAALQQAGFSPEDVPAAGVLAPLRRIESTEWGGVDEDVSDRVHPENLRIALEAASLFGLHMAGIDIISEDISQPWHANGAILNEVNFSPLFGGGDISRSHIPRFLQAYVPEGGRIPVELFAPDQLAAAQARQQALVASGLRCWLTGHEHTVDPQGRPVVLALAGAQRRLRALLLRPDVDAVVAVARTRTHTA